MPYSDESFDSFPDMYSQAGARYQAGTTALSNAADAANPYYARRKALDDDIEAATNPFRAYKDQYQALGDQWSPYFKSVTPESPDSKSQGIFAKVYGPGEKRTEAGDAAFDAARTANATSPRSERVLTPQGQAAQDALTNKSYGSSAWAQAWRPQQAGPMSIDDASDAAAKYTGLPPGPQLDAWKQAHPPRLDSKGGLGFNQPPPASSAAADPDALYKAQAEFAKTFGVDAAKNIKSVGRNGIVFFDPTRVDMAQQKFANNLDVQGAKNAGALGVAGANADSRENVALIGQSGANSRAALGNENKLALGEQATSRAMGVQGLRNEGSQSVADTNVSGRLQQSGEHDARVADVAAADRGSRENIALNRDNFSSATAAADRASKEGIAGNHEAGETSRTAMKVEGAVDAAGKRASGAGGAKGKPPPGNMRTITLPDGSNYFLTKEQTGYLYEHFGDESSPEAQKYIQTTGYKMRAR